MKRRDSTPRHNRHPFVRQPADSSPQVPGQNPCRRHRRRRYVPHAQAGRLPPAISACTPAPAADDRGWRGGVRALGVMMLGPLNFNWYIQSVIQYGLCQEMFPVWQSQGAKNICKTTGNMSVNTTWRHRQAVWDRVPDTLTSASSNRCFRRARSRRARHAFGFNTQRKRIGKLERKLSSRSHFSR